MVRDAKSHHGLSQHQDIARHLAPSQVRDLAPMHVGSYGNYRAFVTTRCPPMHVEHICWPLCLPPWRSARAATLSHATLHNQNRRLASALASTTPTSLLDLALEAHHAATCPNIHPQRQRECVSMMQSVRNEGIVLQGFIQRIAQKITSSFFGARRSPRPCVSSSTSPGRQGGAPSSALTRSDSYAHVTFCPAHSSGLRPS